MMKIIQTMELPGTAEYKKPIDIPIALDGFTLTIDTIFIPLTNKKNEKRRRKI